MLPLSRSDAGGEACSVVMHFVSCSVVSYSGTVTSIQKGKNGGGKGVGLSAVDAKCVVTLCTEVQNYAALKIKNFKHNRERSTGR